MDALRLGFVALARPTFDVPLATATMKMARAALTEAGLTLVGPEALISDLPAAEAAARELAEEPLDLLVIFQATFADSTPALALAEASRAPVLLWAVPEARTGGRLRLNSLCGINLAGHALTLRGLRYDHLYAAPDSPEAIARVSVLARAGRVQRLLRGARVGVVGEHPPGFDSCHLDAPLLRARFGLAAVPVDLHGVFVRARSAATQTATVRARLDARLSNLAELEQKPLNGTLGVYTALRSLSDEQNLSGLAVRCWPEFFTELGCAACGAMSMLSDEQLPCSCEADVNGTVTQMILQGLSDQPAFGADLVEVSEATNSAVVWHCGLAPASMADPAVALRGGLHSNRKLPLVMEFPLKPGAVTLARLSRATGELRLVVGRGEMLAAPPSFSGTSGVLRFERPARATLDTILGEGLEHHLSLTYGDFVAELLAFARFTGLPVLRL
jgi:L-fucose isomerase-like protein